jgi:hypothetical protein
MMLKLLYRNQHQSLLDLNPSWHFLPLAILIAFILSVFLFIPEFYHFQLHLLQIPTYQIIYFGLDVSFIIILILLPILYSH